MYLKSMLLILLMFLTGNIEAQETNTYNDSDDMFRPWSVGGSLNFTTGNFYTFYLFSNLESFTEVDQSTRIGVSPVVSYRFDKYFGANVLLGFNRFYQEGSNLIIPFPGPNPVALNSRGVTGTEYQYSFGASIDRYLILKKIFGFRLELGGNYTLIKSTVELDAVSISGFNILPREENSSTTHAIGAYLSPRIDFFIGDRINIVANMGSIGYYRSALENSSNAFWQFQSSLSPANIGLGIEFNF